MELLAIPISLAAIALSAVAITTPHGRSLTPALFAALIACAGVAHLGASHGDALAAAVAAAGAAVSAAGLCLNILRVDAHLTAEEVGLVPVLPAWSLLDRRRRWREFEHDFWTAVRAHASLRRTFEGPADTLYSFARKGRLSLFVLVRRDRDGQIVEASAYDPEEHS